MRTVCQRIAQSLASSWLWGRTPESQATLRNFAVVGISDSLPLSLLVSHDRDFLDRVVTSVVASQGNGRWIEYAGGFTDMLAQRAEAPRGSPPTKAGCVKQAQPATQSGALPSGLPRRMNFNDRRALAMLPARIVALETQIAELNVVLADPDLYARDPARFGATTGALAVARDELVVAEEQWLRLEMLREEIEAAEARY